MSKVTVDILLPYWGEFSLLKKAVDSVLAQTEENWRMIIIDDCYPSLEASDYYSNYPDPRIEFHRNETNRGIVGNYNYGIDLASAEHTIVMGCDDKMLPEYLQTALSKIGDSSYYQPGVQVIDENDTPYLPLADRIKRFIRPRKEGIYSGEKLAASLCHGNWTYYPSLMWKTSVLKKHRFDESKPNTHDFLTQLEIIQAGGTLYIDNTTTFQYRRSASSFSSKAKTGTRFLEESRVYTQLAHDFKKMGWHRAARAAQMHITIRLHKLLS